MSGFQRAVKTTAKARVAFYGVGGSGKTTYALMLARTLAGVDGTIALLDAEGGSAGKYADDWEFDMKVQRPPFHPSKVAEAIKAAADSGYTVFVADGISPYWSGSGGVLEIVDESKKRGGGWADGTPAHGKLINALLDSPIHVIFTVRAKSETIVEKDANGKTTIRKVGLKPDTREGLEYEVDALLYCDVADNSITIEKTRIARQLGLKIPAERGQEWATGFKAWLDSGAAAPAAPVVDDGASDPGDAPPAPAAPPPAAPPAASAPADPILPPTPPAPETPVETPPGAAPEPTSEGRRASRARIAASLARLGELDTARDWKALIAEKLPSDDFFPGKTSEPELTDAEAESLADRLDATVAMLVEQAAK